MGQFNAVLKDWRVVVGTLSGAEVFEFDVYAEAMLFAREHATGLHGADVTEVIDKVARVVWSSNTSGDFEDIHGVDDASQGIYRWNEDSGWFELSSGDWGRAPES